MLSSLWLPTTLFLFPYISSVRPFHFLPILGFLLIIQVYIAILRRPFLHIVISFLCILFCIIILRQP